MNFQKLEKYLDRIEVEGAPFAGIKVVYKGKMVFEKIFGKKDDGTAADYNDLFFKYSSTKVVTAVAAMQLVEQGKIGLDEPVYKYIPEYKNLVVGKERIPAKNTLTVRHLLSMTSGYGYDFNAENLKKACGNKNASTIEVVREMAKDYLHFEPGEKFEYGFGLDIISAVIEVVSGMTYGEYVKKNIFEPLEMNDSTYQVDQNIKDRLLPQYRYNSQTKAFEPERKENVFILTDAFESGGAGLISSIDDYIRLVKALANYGAADNGYMLLKPSSIDLMREDNLGDKVKDFFKPDYSYGLGVRTLINKENSKSPLGEFGWDSAACAYSMIDVDNNLGLFYGCHTLGWDNGYAHHCNIRDLVYESLGI